MLRSETYRGRDIKVDDEGKYKGLYVDGMYVGPYLNVTAAMAAGRKVVDRRITNSEKHNG